VQPESQDQAQQSLAQAPFLPQAEPQPEPEKKEAPTPRRSEREKRDDPNKPAGSKESTQSNKGEHVEARHWSTGWVIGIVGLILVLLLVGLAISITVRLIHKHRLDEATAEKANAPPRVQVVLARHGSTSSLEALPGSSQAFYETGVYGRTNGYLKSLLVDIGDKVKAGQLMAEISAPEVDAQLDQARAVLQQTKATLESNKAAEAFSRPELERYTQLRKPGAATQEAYENRLMTERTNVATIHATEATIKSNEATVQQLATMVSYQKLIAPFDGIVTVRTVNPGDLITADNPSSERQLFRVAKIDPLRVFVDVPQPLSTVVHVGQDALLYRMEEPGRNFHGKVARTASALNPITRTLRTEVDVSNPTGALLPGMYLQVKFIIDRTSIPVLVPTDAVIVRTAAPKVAILDQDERVQYRTVQLGRDYGKTIEVLTGLKEGERVIVHPGDDLEEGIQVQPIQAGDDKKGQNQSNTGDKSDSGDKSNTGDKQQKSGTQKAKPPKPGAKDPTGAKQGEKEDSGQSSAGGKSAPAQPLDADETQGTDDVSRRSEEDRGRQEGMKPQDASKQKGQKKQDQD